MIDLKLLSPRVGVTYALDDANRTLLRASYGLFGSQLGSGTVQSFSAASQALLVYSATDRNGNNVADPGRAGRRCKTFAGVDPAFARIGGQLQPRQPRSGPRPRPTRSSVGIDREIMPQLGVSAVDVVAPVLPT